MRRLVDHTADVAIEADGATPGEALAEAALALVELLLGRSPHGLSPQEELEVAVEAPDLEALAVAWLAELVWLQQSRDTLWLSGGVHVERRGAVWVASGRGNGLRHDPKVHGRGVEVKAVTYHDVGFARQGARWRLRVVLDL